MTLCFHLLACTGDDVGKWYADASFDLGFASGLKFGNFEFALDLLVGFNILQNGASMAVLCDHDRLGGSTTFFYQPRSV